jgi:hypothetical protein
MAKIKYHNGTDWVVAGTDASAVDIVDSGELYTATNVEDALAEVKNQVATHEAKDATTAAKGHIQLATNAEVTTGTDTSKAVTPAGAKVELDKKVSLTGGTMSGELNCADQLLTRPYIKDYAEVVGTTPATTGAVNFDLTTGNTFNLTPTGPCTIALLNPPANGRVGSFTLQINMPATLYAITFPASFKWDGGIIPTFEVSKTAVITGYTIDGGTKYRVSCVGTKFTT